MLTLADLASWMQDVSRPGYLWYIKRLSGNDTLANGAHQYGPYIPKPVLRQAFPELVEAGSDNPRVPVNVSIDSHSETREVNVIWYREKTRNEMRITGWGGKISALLNPENTGALVLFVFVPSNLEEAVRCRIWVCTSPDEEDFLEDRVGPVEPGQAKSWTLDSSGSPALQLRIAESPRSCSIKPNEIPQSWLSHFPGGVEIIAKTLEMRPPAGLSPDERLIKRRDCEYEIFLSIEEAHELPVIQRGFATIDEFIGRAQTILQRRKSRSGRSLELHTKALLVEEGFVQDRDFAYQVESEPGRKPDFLFPSQAAYRNPTFPADGLRMLAVKTTCKDRWRQILNEAERIPVKYLLTLQEGISRNQFFEMDNSGVRLVVPASLHMKYPNEVRPHLLTLASFMREIRRPRN